MASRHYSSNLVTQLNEGTYHADDFLKACRKWLFEQKSNANEINTIITNLNSIHHSANVAKLSGATAGIIGGAMVIGGLALAPVTFGSSLGLVAAGGVVGAGGALVGIGAALAEMGMSSGQCKDVERRLNKGQQEFQVIKEKLNRLSAHLEVIYSYAKTTIFDDTVETAKVIGGVINAAKKTHDAVIAVKAIRAVSVMMKDGGKSIAVIWKTIPHAINDAKMITQVVGQTTKALSKSVRFVGIAVNAVFIPLDIWTLVSTSIDVSNGSEHPSSAQLGLCVKGLQEQMTEVEAMCQKVTKCAEGMR